jgi:hypothetical protein
MINLAAADGAISCWNDKWYWHFWRPRAAIREADTDGNPNTIADPNWESLFASATQTTPPLETPPFPDHPSGHGCVSGATVDAFQDFFGTDKVEFDVVGGRSLNGVPIAPRHFERFSSALKEVIDRWASTHGRKLRIKMEPGRYAVAESSVLLGTVHSVKQNGSKNYIGTDIGFNVLVRPVMYDSYHDVEFYRNDELLKSDETLIASVVGNICETGDILAKDRELPAAREGDIIGVTDAGAYGYSMSSNYNSRLRPAEVMIGLDGTPRLIRRRDTFEDLMRGFVK